MMLRLGIICLVLFHIKAYAQYPLLHYTKKNGLPSDIVYDVYRDSRGFMWIATDKGVARFDGTSFQTFNTGDGLPDNEVFFFQEDYQDRIWLATYSGALCYYKNGIFHNARNTPFLKTLLPPDVPCRITLQRDSSLVIVYKRQTAFINIKNDSCRIYQRRLRNKVGYSIPSNVHKLADSIYRISYQDELHYLNVITGTTSYKIPEKKIHSLTSQNQEILFDDKFIYDQDFKRTGEVPQPLQGRTHINRLYFDGKRHLIATDDGLYIGKQQLFKDKRVVSVTEDIAGCYWIATLGDGIYTIHKDFEKSRLIANAYTGVVTYACAYEDAQYFATNERQLYEVKDGNVKMLFDFSEGIPNVRNQGDHVDCSINKHRIYCIGRKGTVFVYDILKKTIKRYTLPEIHRELVSTGKSIIATDSGLNVISAVYIHFIPAAYFENSLHIPRVMFTDFHSRIYAITADDNSNIIHSRPDGIYVTAGMGSSLQAQYGKRLFIWLRYYHNTLVGCTPDNELFFFSVSEKGIKADSFISEKAIWDNAYPLSQGQLLLMSDKHYYTLTLPGSGRPAGRPVPLKNPFLPPDAAYILNSSAYCYFFKNRNITIVDTKDLSGPGPVPDIYYDKITIGGHIYRLGSKDAILTFPAGYASNAHVRFDILAFNAADARYEYCIIQDGNIRTGWEPVTNKELNLVLPRYGNTTILARARMPDGTSTIPRQFTITLLKPWWAQWWGLILIGLCVLALLWLSFYFYMRRALKRKEKEHHAEIRLLNAEFRTLNAMMNPHFIFNTLNNIQAFIHAGNKQQANEYIRTFSDMVRQNMINISKEMVTLADEMAIVERYLELQCLRFSHIAYDIVVDPDVDTDDVLIPPLLIQPLVENSIKHGLLPSGRAGGCVWIVISGRDDMVTIAITDNGIGISRSKARSASFALEALKKRIDSVNATQNVTITFEISDHISPPYTSGTRALLTIAYRS